MHFCAADDCIKTAVEVGVTDAQSGEALETAEVQRVIADGSAHPLEGDGNCWHLSDNSLDRARQIASAPGCEEVSFEVEIDRDLCGAPVGERRQVALSREVGTSVVKKKGTLEGCWPRAPIGFTAAGARRVRRPPPVRCHRAAA